MTPDRSSPAVVAISPQDFDSVAPSGRPEPTTPPKWSKPAKAGFTKFFAAGLARVTVGPPSPSQLLDPAPRARKTRPYACAAPELFPFTTTDGVDLLLTVPRRFQGTSDGDPRAGVSSRIF